MRNSLASSSARSEAHGHQHVQGKLPLRHGPLRLLSGESDPSDYQFNTKRAHHVFCKHCGVRSFGRAHVEAIGGDYVMVNVACLDGVDPKLLAEAPVHFADGRNDNWQSPPAETRHL